jgi:SAM-dependent methyltransferase
MQRIFKKLWTSSPSDTFAALRAKLRPPATWDYSLHQVLASKKHMNAQYLIDRWERYWRVIECQHGDNSKKKYDFRGTSVLELGCGPLFGWGPIAIFRGAEHYFYHEPFLLREVVETVQIREHYFVPLYNELTANFGTRMGFDEFYRRTMAKCQPIEFERTDTIDIVLSNSVLEHIPIDEIDSLLAQLYDVSKPGAHYFHSIDFGAHNIGGTDFGTLYETDRMQGFKHLNRLRKSEIEASLRRSRFAPLHSTVYRTGILNRMTMNAFWNEYAENDLSARVVFFVGKKAG